MITRNRLLTICALTCLAFGAHVVGAGAATVPAWAPIGGTGPTNLPPIQNETQNVAVTAAGGTFTLTFNGQTTAPLAFNADAGEVESALNSLSSIGGAGGGVSVKGGPGGPSGNNTAYVVIFKGGSFSGVNQPALTAGTGGLSGSVKAVEITTLLEGGPGTSTLVMFIQNVGGANSTGPTTLTGEMPEGILLNGPASEAGWTCTNSVDAKAFTCTTTSVTVPAGSTSKTPQHPIKAEPGASGTKAIHLTVSGGGAVAPASFDVPVTISEDPAGPGFQAFTAGAYDEEGSRDTRAGGHPYAASTAIINNTIRSSLGRIVPAGEFKDINVSLPPGFVGNPTAAPTCPRDTPEPENILEFTQCPLNSVVGIVQPGTEFGGFYLFKEQPVVNVEAPFGYPAEFKFNNGGEVVHVIGKLRSDGDYGLDIEAPNVPQIIPVFATFFTFWGVPASNVHNANRCKNLTTCGPSTAPETAFLTNPNNCAEEAVTPPVTTLTTNTWEKPSIFSRQDIVLPPVTGCENLEFDADFTFEPSDTKADSTASFRSSLTVPSEGLLDPTKLTTPTLRSTVVQLPKGVVLNASGADGLQSCSLQQIGYMGKDFPMPNPIRFNKDPNQCPESSKIGNAELKSALLDNPLHGALYLAAQGDGNPFGSLFAIYLVIEDPQTGLFIKLPGRVDPDPATGQMTVTFTNLPQVPFERLDLNLKGGNRSALASPTTCGNYVTTATNTPWSAPESGPPTVSSNGFEINQGPNGMPCANTPQERPFNIGWSAGAQSVSAGASGPFTFQVTRPDGSQELDSLELNTPPGVSASLRGIPYCTEAQIAQAQASTGKQEQSNPACPAASQVGTLQTGAGSGPTPFYVGGKIYLAGPYKGAPISVVVVTPAVAGPFDLGNVVVRSAVNINRATAQVSAKSDPIPQFLKGVGLRIRDVRITLDRDKWTINPTSCDPSTVNLRAYGNSGAVADRSTRFQVGNCQSLPFAPKLRASLKGGTKRGDHPAFTAVVDFPAGQANTKDVQVVIPHSEFLEQAHINTICTRVQAAANACPAGAIYGYAEAETPLIDGKLTGPVFLKSNPNHKLPDLAIALKGPDNQPIEVEFAGRIDSVKGQIRNTIEGLPDVPVSKFVLRMKGGRKGLLANSRDLCASKVTKMTVSMVGHNNKTTQFRPPLSRKCTGKGKKAAKSRDNRTRLGRLVAGAW